MGLLLGSHVLLVIFGAGASYDSSPDRLPPEPPFGGDDPSRPPLANDLFVDKDLYRQFRNAFPQFLDVIGELLPRGGWSIENALQQLDAEASKNSRRKQQLAAIR